MFWLSMKASGTKKYCQLTSDDPVALERLAKRLRTPLHGKGMQEKHLDLKGHKIEVAKKHGAVEVDRGSLSVRDGAVVSSRGS